MYIHTCLDIYTCKYLYIYIPIHIRASIYATDLFQTPKSEFMVFVNPPVMSWHKGIYTIKNYKDDMQDVCATAYIRSHLISGAHLSHGHSFCLKI